MKFIAMLAVVLGGCGGCDFYVDGICVTDETDSIKKEDVRSAIGAVRDECALTMRESLKIAFLENAPEFSEGGSPIPGDVGPNHIRIWARYVRPMDVLMHELIHAGLFYGGRRDTLHTDPTIWCFTNRVDSCEARIVETCTSG